MPLLQTRGAGSAKGLGLTASAAAVSYIEEVFSTYLYTGTGAALTITNGVDLSTKGGLVWAKRRDTGTTPPTNANAHILFDTSRGQNVISTNTTDAQYDQSASFTPLTTGFSLSTSASSAPNATGASLVSWTFRKQPKFFDVVTYTGTGSNTTIAHNLGSVPGCIIVKCTSHGVGWNVYHRSLTSAAYELELNTTSAEFSDPTIWNSTAPTSTVFSVGTNLGINGSGRTYVAYIFAHDAGGFGLTGTDNVISCGTFTTDGSGNATVNLGYEPQFIIRKRSDDTSNWDVSDIMRRMDNTDFYRLRANLSDAEDTANGGPLLIPTATGFTARTLGNTATHIYIAIRRGPMKVPTLGTSVYNAIARTGNGTTATITGVGFAPDFIINTSRVSARSRVIFDKLRGTSVYLSTDGTYAEETAVTQGVTFFDMDGFRVASANYVNQDTEGMIHECFRRAPSFFDEVCYTGTNVAGNTINHNLTVAPELIIIKRRATAGTYWDVSTLLGATTYTRLFFDTDALYLGTPQTYGVAGVPLYSKPTATQLQFGVNSYVNASDTYVAYLFATCAGVSKVGSYTGTATTLQIDCGFTGGARFVLIKRTDSTGDWYVWDSARGIVAGNDPYLLLNSTAVEVTNTDYIDTYSAGFEISSTAPAAINASAGTFVFLAIA